MKTPTGTDHASLSICLLGDLRLTDADGVVRKLPASKKTRALIGYLIATGQPHRRANRHGPERPDSSRCRGRTT